MKEMKLTQGKVALVDDEDFEWLLRFKWCLKGDYRTSYAHTWIDGTMITMHRLILQASRGEEVDHINGNGLDNQRGNLRLCVRTLNAKNRRKFTECSSRFKGVNWHKWRNRWATRIQKDHLQISLGYFLNEEDAARAYDNAATELFGEFALTNKAMGLL
jgi:hypothetical protein